LSVRTEIIQADWKEINRGVRKGWGLSPELFIIYIWTTTVKEWRQKPHGFAAIDRHISTPCCLLTTLFS